MTTSVSSQCQVVFCLFANSNLCLILNLSSETDLCESTESDCPPRYCGSPALWKPARVNCQCNGNCTGESNTTFGAQCLLAEPFEFGAWNETRECDKSCFLKMERHCEPVVLPGLTPPECNDQNTIRPGNTSCSPCKGDFFILWIIMMIKGTFPHNHQGSLGFNSGNTNWHIAYGIRMYFLIHP